MAEGDEKFDSKTLRKVYFKLSENSKLSLRNRKEIKTSD